MRRSRNLEHRHSLTDLRRLVALPDLAPYLGDLILRRSLKIVAITGGAALAGSVATIFGFSGPTLKEAASMTLMIGICLTGLGLFLKLTPLFIRKARGVAEASQINLLEDARKERASRHLGELWDRVCRYEGQWKAEEEEREAKKLAQLENSLTETYSVLGMGEKLAQTCSEHHIELPIDAPCTRKGFVASALYRIHHPHPAHQPLRRFRTVIGLYQNYCDGAPFHSTDSKLLEEGEHDMTLAKIKALAYRSDWGPLCSSFRVPAMKIRESWLRWPQKFWFPICVRAISSRTGRAISHLNHLHGVTRLDALNLLWPGAEEQVWISQFKGLREGILEERKSMFQDLFGPDQEGARRILDRMLLPNAEIATEIRYRFDPDYCSGVLKGQLESDMRTLGCEDSYFEYHLRVSKQRADRLGYFDVFIERNFPEYLDRPDDRLCLRIAYMTCNGLQKKHLRDEGAAELKKRFGEVLSHSSKRRHQLLYIRTYQTLTMIALREYRDHLQDLLSS